MHFFQIVQFLSSLHANWTISGLLILKLSSLHANWIKTGQFGKNCIFHKLGKIEIRDQLSQEKTKCSVSFFVKFDFSQDQKVQFVSSLHANWTISGLLILKLSSLHANWIKTGQFWNKCISHQLGKIEIRDQLSQEKTKCSISFFVKLDFSQDQKVQFVSSLHANWTISGLLILKLSSLHANWIKTGQFIPLLG